MLTTVLRKILVLVAVQIIEAWDETCLLPNQMETQNPYHFPGIKQAIIFS